MKKLYSNTVPNIEVRTRYKKPVNNLLYCILLQAVIDNDIDYLKHGDGRIIWEYLKTQEKE